MVTCHINEDRIFVTGSHVVMRDALEETKKKKHQGADMDGWILLRMRIFFMAPLCNFWVLAASLQSDRRHTVGLSRSREDRPTVLRGNNRQ